MLVKCRVCHSHSTTQAQASATSAIQLVREIIPSPRSTTASSRTTAKTAVGAAIGSFATNITRRTNGIAAANAGTLRRARRESPLMRGVRKADATEKKSPKPATTASIPLMLEAIGGAVTIHKPAVPSVSSKARTRARSEAELQAIPIATTSTKSTQAQTANEVSPCQTQSASNPSASSGR